MTPKVSIIIPIEEINDYLREALVHLGRLDYPDFEILVFTTKETTEKFFRTRFIVNPELARRPAEKRDLALKYAKGEILAFSEDDAYPRPDWLKNAVGYFSDPNVAAVCGPGVTPPEDSVGQQVSGWVQASRLGGGDYTYRFLPQKKRFVDDYPSMNFLVRKKDFEKVGGFDSHFYPGEDTKLCHELVYGLGKKIIYAPDVLVYHHRRSLWRPYLKQIGGYGLHRGHFARVLPRTSRRLSYLIPVLFALGFFSGPPLILAARLLAPVLTPLLFWFYLFSLGFYGLWLLATAFWVFLRSRNLAVALLTIPAIFLTHLWYGLRFVQGFFSEGLPR